ncbi:MAG: phage holin family protein [Gemmatimonadales bacterium]|nr:phage holin family protein [Gemmatimonadales bacterium]
MLGILGRYFLVWVVSVCALLLATSLLPGFRIDTMVPLWWISILRLPILFSLLLILLRPLLIVLTLPLNALTLGFPSLLFNGLILYLTAQVEPAIIITNYGEALLGTLVMTTVSAGVVGWLGLDEAYPLFQSLVFRLGLSFGPRYERKPLRGLLILQIDGLSHTSLKRALRRGRMPTLSGMLARNTHYLHRWHCGVPSNTPAVQAGLFYGNRENVAGYRWFDRSEQKIRVVSNGDDLRWLEGQVAQEGGKPLLAGGSCINSFMAGGADKRLLTVNALGEPSSARREGELADFNLFFLSPNSYTKAIIAIVWDYLSGLMLALVGRVASDRPRLKFNIKRLAHRAIANAFLRDLSFFWLKQDMVRGVPVIYSNFVGYDEVAHFSGPDTYAAQISLAAYDRQLRRLRRRARGASPIRYDIVLLSDHGQAPSIPFRILCGQTIDEALAGMMGRVVTEVIDPSRALDPDASYTGALLAELEETGSHRLGWAWNRGRRALSRLSREPLSPFEGLKQSLSTAGAVVCVSGCLGHIYFPGHDEPLHLEDVCALFPGLVEELSRHPGIGFVAASRRFGDAVAICDDGIRNLITGEKGGHNDPFASYPDSDRWDNELAQLLGYPDSGDLIINGRWLEDEGQVVVLEEQTSSHGGLGGRQTEPFVLLPSTWQLGDEDLDSPEALHRLLSRELARYRQAAET